MAVATERIRAVRQVIADVTPAFAEALLPLQAETEGTTWDRSSLQEAIDSMHKYLEVHPQDASSVYARIGFNSGIAKDNSLPKDTLHLLLFVESSQVEATREVFIQGSVAWNQEHTDNNRFLEVHIKPAYQEATTLANATDIYHQVYDCDADDIDDFIESISDDPRALAREQRQAKKRKGHGTDEITRALKYQPSRDHTNFVTQPPEPDEETIVARDRASKLLERDLSGVGRDFNWVRYYTNTAILFEDPLDNLPLQDFTTQSPKNYHGFARRGKLEVVARLVAGNAIKIIATRKKDLEKPSPSVYKLLHRLAKREARHAARTTTETAQAQNGHENGPSVRTMEDKGEVYVYRPVLSGNHQHDSPIPRNGNGKVDTRKVIFTGVWEKRPMEPTVIPWF